MNVERLISDLARDIATAEPRADFSARVLDRIDASDRRSRRLRAIGGTTGLLAAAALTVFVVRSSPARPATLPDLPKHADARSATPAPVVEPAVVAGAATQTIPAKRRSAPPTPVIPTAEQEWLARAVPVLAPATPITIEKPHTAESIQPASLQIPLMGMDVIGSDPLSIAPIGGIRH